MLLSDIIPIICFFFVNVLVTFKREKSSTDGLSQYCLAPADSEFEDYTSKNCHT